MYKCKVKSLRDSSLTTSLEVKVIKGLMHSTGANTSICAYGPATGVIGACRCAELRECKRANCVKRTDRVKCAEQEPGDSPRSIWRPDATKRN